MLIHEATRPLGQVDCVELTARVLGVDDQEWFRDPRRQQEYDVHAQTQSLILAFCEGWPKVKVSCANGWGLLATHAVPVIERIIASHYPPQGVLLRAMMARLPAGCRIARHRDAHPSFGIAHRIHIPLATNPDVEFIVGTERVLPRQHYAFELNNQLFHQVANRGSDPRIHFIFDYAPPHSEVDYEIPTELDLFRSS